MPNSELINRIPEVKDCLSKHPVERAWLFGSCSRGDDREDSDVDILVQYTKNSRITLFTIGRIVSSLERILGRQVDVVEDGCLRPFAVEGANRDKILIYERQDQG